MDPTSLIAIFNQLPPSVQAALLAFLVASYAASHICSATPTPPPNTAWGRIYAGLELLAGIWGQAKAIGVPEPTITGLMADLNAALASGQPVTPEVFAGIAAKYTPAPKPAPTLAPLPNILCLLGVGFMAAACASNVQLTSAQLDARAVHRELVLTSVAVTVAGSVAGEPGLSAATVDEIRTAAVGVGNAVLSQTSSMQQGGSITSQALAAIASAAASAIPQIGGLITAAHGSTATPTETAMAAGESALLQAPELIGLVSNLSDPGWVPGQDILTQDVANLTAALAKLQPATGTGG